MIIVLIAELLEKQNTCNVVDPLFDNQIICLTNGAKMPQLVYQRGGAGQHPSVGEIYYVNFGFCSQMFNGRRCL